MSCAAALLFALPSVAGAHGGHGPVAEVGHLLLHALPWLALLAATALASWLLHPRRLR